MSSSSWPACVRRERTRSLLFVLSLPVSTTQYTVAKVVVDLIAFVVPVAAADGRRASCVIDVTPIPNG